MYKLTLFILFFAPILCHAQLNEHFSDGDFTQDPVWSGHLSNFEVNAAFQLHSKATVTGTSALFCPSVAFDDASWECWVKMNYPTSSSNFSSIYLASDKMETADCKAYYVQIGGTNDEVALFVQEGTKKTKIIDGIDKRTDGSTLEMRIKVTRDAQGNFSLYSKLASETEFILEGETQNLLVARSAYFGLLFSNTTTTGAAYYFDNVVVTGNPAVIPQSFDRVKVGEVVLNEIMFENPTNSVEYIEIYNSTDKILDLSSLSLTTRKADGTLNAGISVSSQATIRPNSYLVLTSDADALKSFYGLTASENIRSTQWSSLNNEGNDLVLTNLAQDTIFDEVTYSVKWHHPLVKNPKGVALERIHPALPSQASDSWHSAASSVNFGTPGYQNSQFHVINPILSPKKFVWVEPESFSPDNDGVNDLCQIHYKTDNNGYLATLLIFDAAGNKVCQLASNSLLASEGFFSWDGRTQSNRTANVGLYVLYFEAFNSLNGVRKSFKLPIVVSVR